MIFSSPALGGGERQTNKQTGRWAASSRKALGLRQWLNNNIVININAFIGLTLRCQTEWRVMER